jgi:hypothetical protein
MDRQPIKPTFIFSEGEAQAFKTVGATLTAAAAMAVFFINFRLLKFIFY